MMHPSSTRPPQLPAAVILVVTGLCAFWMGPTVGRRVVAAPPDARGTTLYDPDTKPLWNRLHQPFHIRETFRDGDRDVSVSADQTFHPDALAPFLWDRRSYLLTGPAHREALA